VRNIALTVGAGWGTEIFGRIRIYTGLGVGPSVWINNTRYLSGGIDEISYKIDLAYQARLGAAYIVSERLDLDFATTLQNRGKTGINGPAFSIIGDVVQTEFRLWLAYKFGI